MFPVDEVSGDTKEDSQEPCPDTKDVVTDARLEMQKLFSQMKAGRKKAASVPAVHFKLPPSTDYTVKGN